MSDTEALKANVARTLRTSQQVLAAMESSLQQSGFSAGAASYRQMADALVGQKLWSTAHPDPAVDRLFDEVAAHADAIHGMLAPYLKAMVKLRALNGRIVAEGPSSAASAPGDQVLAAIERSARPMSTTEIADAVSLPVSDVNRLLSALTASGKVRRANPGGRALYAFQRAV